MRLRFAIRAIVATTLAVAAVGCSSEPAATSGSESEVITNSLSLAFTCTTAPKTATNAKDATQSIDYEARTFTFNLEKIEGESVDFAPFATEEEDDDGRPIRVKGYFELGEYICTNDESGLACHIENLNSNWTVSRTPRRIVIEGDGDGCEWSTLKLEVPKKAGDVVDGSLAWEGTTNCFGSDLFPRTFTWDVTCTTEAIR